MEVLNNLSLIAAIGKNYELGLDNGLPWHIPEDLMFYRETTFGSNIIMGRNTFESMPAAAFRGRIPFVISRQPLDKFYDIDCFNSIESMLEYIKKYKEKQFIVVGGEQIYREFLPYVSTMYLTHIQEYFPADTHFPKFDTKEWNITILGNFWKADIPYIRKGYTRIKQR